VVVKAVTEAVLPVRQALEAAAQPVEVGVVELWATTPESSPCPGHPVAVEQVRAAAQRAVVKAVGAVELPLLAALEATAVVADPAGEAVAVPEAKAH
jgi:hypothetical protein